MTPELSDNFQCVDINDTDTEIITDNSQKVVFAVILDRNNGGFELNRMEDFAFLERPDLMIEKRNKSCVSRFV